MRLCNIQHTVHRRSSVNDFCRPAPVSCIFLSNNADLFNWEEEGVEVKVKTTKLLE